MIRTVLVYKRAQLKLKKKSTKNQKKKKKKVELSYWCITSNIIATCGQPTLVTKTLLCYVGCTTFISSVYISPHFSHTSIDESTPQTNRSYRLPILSQIQQLSTIYIHIFLYIFILSTIKNQTPSLPSSHFSQTPLLI